MAFDDIESTFADAVDGDANARKTISTILRRVNSPQQPVVVMQQPQQQPVEEPLDPVEYETRVQERVRALDDKLSFTDAQNWFHHEFSDVVNDGRRWQWAARNDAELARTHPELSHKARLQIIGQAARSVPSGHDVDSTEAVQEMMRSRRRVDLDGTGEEIDLSDNVPTSEDRERSDAIKKMRQARAPHNPVAPLFDWSAGDE